MYQERLLQCAQETRFQVAALPRAGVSRRNPACGDEIEAGVEVDAGGMVSVRYVVQACAVTRASAAILAGALEGVSLEEARGRVAAGLGYFSGERDWEGDWCGEEMRALGAVRAFPMRMACVRLPWEAVGAGLEQADHPPSP